MWRLRRGRGHALMWAANGCTRLPVNSEVIGDLVWPLALGIGLVRAAAAACGFVLKSNFPNKITTNSACYGVGS